jgi:hypothetical protein
MHAVLARRAPSTFCRADRHPRPQGCCVSVDRPPDRPDPATYSQGEQLALGAQPTWNSPDIVTNATLPWGPWPTVDVTVRNLSATASAVNVLVHLERGPFGVGMALARESTKVLSLGPSEETVLNFALPVPAAGADPDVSVVATIEHPTDARLINNRGEQTIAGATTTQVGRSPSIPFPVRNPLGSPQTIMLAALTNSLGAVVSPAAHAFAPFEQIQATLKLSVPAGMHGTGAQPAFNEVTVLARGQNGSVVGGVSYLLWVDD